MKLTMTSLNLIRLTTYLMIQQRNLLETMTKFILSRHKCWRDRLVFMQTTLHWSPEWCWDRRNSEADSESRLGIELSPYEMSATVTELVWSQRTPTGSFMQTTPTHLRLPNLSILVGKFEIDYSGQCSDICIQQKTDFSLWSCRLVNGWSLHWEGLNWEGWTERPLSERGLG